MSLIWTAETIRQNYWDKSSNYWDICPGSYTGKIYRSFTWHPHVYPQVEWATLSPVSTELSTWVIPSRYGTSHSGQLRLLSLAEREMSTGKKTVAGLCSWEGNHRSGVAPVMPHTQTLWYAGSVGQGRETRTPPIRPCRSISPFIVTWNCHRWGRKPQRIAKLTVSNRWALTPPSSRR